MDNFEHVALSPNTRSSYASGWSCFSNFCTMNCVQISEQHLPVINEDILMYFATHCATTLKLSYTTIKLYLCGIRAHYISVLGINPLKQATGLPLYRLKLIMDGIRKQQPPRVHRPRLPITHEVLSQLCTLLRSGVYGPYMDTLLEAVFCLGYFGFLRCGEFTTQTLQFDPQIHLSVGDVTFTRNADDGCIIKMTLLLKTSKTDPFRAGCELLFFPTAKFLCPTTAMAKYLMLRYAMPYQPSDPLFLLLPNKLPLSRAVLVDHLRHLLQRLGYHADHFAGHSFRKGAATSAAAAHVPDHLLKTMGRWSSDCYQRYIQTPLTLLQEAQLLLA